MGCLTFAVSLEMNRIFLRSKSVNLKVANGRLNFQLHDLYKFLISIFAGNKISDSPEVRATFTKIKQAIFLKNKLL